MTWKFSVAAAAVLALAAPVFADEAPGSAKGGTAEAAPAAPYPSKVEGLELPEPFSVPYDEGFVTVKAVCKGGVEWIVRPVVPEDIKVRIKYRVNDTGNEIDVSVPPVDCHIELYAIGVVAGSDKPTRPAMTIIAVTGARPPPSPSPDTSPDPTPPPVPPAPPTPPPVSGKLFISLVVDPAKPTTDLAALLNSPTMFPRLRAAGHVPRVWSIDDPLVKSKNLLPFVQKAGGAPAFIVQQADGKVLLVGKLPLGEDELLDAIARLQGGN